MRKYIVRFFGCQECGQHFEHMAQETLEQVQTGDQAVLWLWSKHNLVNSRLAGRSEYVCVCKCVCRVVPGR